MSTNEHSTNTPRAHSSRDGNVFDIIYFRTLDGILKKLEMIFDIVAFSCAAVWQDVPNTATFRSPAAGWTMFVTITAVVTTLALYILHACRLIYKLPGPWRLISLPSCCYGANRIFYGVRGSCKFIVTNPLTYITSVLLCLPLGNIIAVFLCVCLSNITSSYTTRLLTFPSKSSTIGLLLYFYKLNNISIGDL
ncbi:hypothetical protein ACJMK2_010876 [Sinanodonta woodiana]|uniref:MARVEL domain-containing protein n=1 Tax=Sinanodonta woodiana TaxID=1069815 RepID=A0ABD3VGV0_SINWO